jgi:hypothetical protein
MREQTSPKQENEGIEAQSVRKRMQQKAPSIKGQKGALRQQKGAQSEGKGDDYRLQKCSSSKGNSKGNGKTKLKGRMRSGLGGGAPSKEVDEIIKCR